MEHIGINKRNAYDGFWNRMRQRIDREAEKSLAVIQEIPVLNGVRWTRETLLQQGELKKSDHLNLRECKPSILPRTSRIMDVLSSSQQTVIR
jgi:hypothetical protein